MTPPKPGRAPPCATCLPPATSRPLPALLAGLSLGWADRKVPFLGACGVCRGACLLPPPPLQAWRRVGVGQAWEFYSWGLTMQLPQSVGPRPWAALGP